jgi:hypothetical protein
MSKHQIWIMVFVGLFSLTALCSYIGDDDVIYRFLDRKPTPHEAIVRIRWVILKAVTSIYGGGVLAPFIILCLVSCCAIIPSKNQVVLLTVVCAGLVSLMISVLQNQIRRVRGRPTRPLIDRAVWQRSLGGPRAD